MEVGRKMKTRTLENIVLGSLTMALATFILIWHYGVGTPVPDYVLMTAAVPVVVAMFGVIRRRWARGEKT
jgi:drug/metabolite transporter (DMT)-like permease